MYTARQTRRGRGLGFLVNAAPDGSLYYVTDGSYPPSPAPNGMPQLTALQTPGAPLPSDCPSGYVKAESGSYWFHCNRTQAAAITPAPWTGGEYGSGPAGPSYQQGTLVQPTPAPASASTIASVPTWVWFALAAGALLMFGGGK